MDRHWFVRHQGKVTGPFLLADLRRLASLGRLTAQHEVSEDKVEWVPSSVVLLDAAMLTSTEDAAPSPPSAKPPVDVAASVQMSDSPPAVHEEAKAGRTTAAADDNIHSLRAILMKEDRRPPVKHEAKPTTSTVVDRPRHDVARPESTASRPGPRRWPRVIVGVLAASGVLVLVLVVLAVVWYKHANAERRAHMDGDAEFVSTQIQAAREMIAKEQYADAKDALTKAAVVASRWQFLAADQETIRDMQQQEEIRIGADGRLKVDGNWLPADVARAYREARRRDDPIISTYEREATTALTEKRYAAGIAACDKALLLIANHPVKTHPRGSAIRLLRDRLQAESVAVEMTARGLVLYQTRWVTPEEKFRLEQTAKGLALYKDKWLPKEEAFAAEQRDKGLVLYNGKWMTPDEKMLAQGYTQFEGKWVTSGEKARILAQRAAEDARRREQLAAEEARRKEEAAKQERLKRVAYLMSQEFLKDKLKSPSTAQFQEYGDRHVTVVQSQGWFIVRGVVDAQNGFGAMIRKTYYCKLRPTTGDKWEADATFLADE